MTYGGDVVELAAEALDGLELGVLVCNEALDRVRYANEAARHLLREVGADVLPPTLRRAVVDARTYATNADALTTATRVALPSGRRLFVRTRALREGQLVTLSGEVLREDELFERLRTRFQLSL